MNKLWHQTKMKKQATKSQKEVYRVIVDENGTYWYNYSRRFHRIGAPAVVLNNGDEYWYIDGLLHRQNGPAIVRAIGIKEWYLNGTQYSQAEFEQLTGENKRPYVGKTITVDGDDYTLT